MEILTKTWLCCSFSLYLNRWFQQCYCCVKSLRKANAINEPLQNCSSAALPALFAYNRNGWPSSSNVICTLQKNLFPSLSPISLCWSSLVGAVSGTNVVLLPQQASYHPDVSEEVRERALRFGTECTLGYLELLEHVLLVRSHLHPYTGLLPRRVNSLPSFYSDC